MKKVLLLFLLSVLFSCEERVIERWDPGESGQQDIVTDASGLQYPYLDPTVVSYCGPGWGRKFCRFLSKYDGTIWADSENYYSDFSDIKFSKFDSGDHFISFLKLDSITSYCEGWKLGETINNGIKWNIRIKKDQEDKLWIGYDYYGTSEEREYTITYRYEVIDGLLHFYKTGGQTFIFSPSEKNYSEDFLETDEIIRLEGCLFN